MGAVSWTGKLEALKEYLKRLGGVLVAFSGGADSSFLLAACTQALPHRRVLAVTAISPSFPEYEKAEADRLIQLMGARHLFVETQEMDNPQYISNPSNRCFFCKDELFQTLAPLAERENLRIADGFNWSDRSDFRPGYRAAARWNVAHPLEETGFTKEEIRQASRLMNLPTWNKPASPCLSSRIPYGTPVTPQTLRQIESAEAVLRQAGFQVVRVRHFGETARVEVGAAELSRLFNHTLRDNLTRQLNKLGYEHVIFDSEGYRSGRLNASVPSTS